MRIVRQIFLCNQLDRITGSRKSSLLRYFANDLYNVKAFESIFILQYKANNY